MKKTLITGTLLLFALAASAQKMNEKSIPTKVQDALHKQYPTAKEITWEKEGSKYEGAFELNETEMSVLLDANGKILETEVEIGIQHLPKKATDYLALNYKGQKIKEAAKITDASGIVSYEAEIKGKDLLFDANGTFIKAVQP